MRTLLKLSFMDRVTHGEAVIRWKCTGSMELGRTIMAAIGNGGDSNVDGSDGERNNREDRGAGGGVQYGGRGIRIKK